MIKSYATSIHTLKVNVEIDIVSLERCVGIDNACYGREGSLISVIFK